jgi:hypothetical protein
VYQKLCGVKCIRSCAVYSFSCYHTMCIEAACTESLSECEIERNRGAVRCRRVEQAGIPNGVQCTSVPGQSLVQCTRRSHVPRGTRRHILHGAAVECKPAHSSSIRSSQASACAPLPAAIESTGSLALGPCLVHSDGPAAQRSPRPSNLRCSGPARRLGKERDASDAYGPIRRTVLALLRPANGAAAAAAAAAAME